MDDIMRWSDVARLVRGRWRFVVALGLVGALLGAACWFLLAPGYEAASKILLQGSREEEEVLAETQIATSLVVLDAVAQGLGDGSTGADLQGRVTASVVEGNVLEIRAVAPDPEIARRLADSATEEYRGFSSRLADEAAGAVADVLSVRQDDLQQRIDDTRDRIDTLRTAPEFGTQTVEGAQSRAELDRLGNVLTSATTELQDVTGRAQEAAADATASRGRIAVIEPAVLLGPASPALTQTVGGGALLLALIGVVALIVAQQTDLRLRDPQRIARTLGAPLLGVVPVDPDGVPAERPAGRIGRLVHHLRAPGAPAAGVPHPDDVRLGRVLARVRPPAGADLPVVLVGGDHLGRRAVEALGRVGAEVALRVVDIDPERPTVPDGLGVGGALVVVSAGTGTAWELAGIAAACTDAGLPVRGVLVAVPGGPAAAPVPAVEEPTGEAAAEPTEENDVPAQESADGPMMAGSS